MSTYQDVLRAEGVLASWALTEAAGFTFAPWIGGSPLAGAGALAYQQPGPFAASFGLQLSAAASLRLTFIATLAPPATFETWIKLSSATPGAPQYVMYSGNGSVNGSGCYLATNGHLHYLAGGVSDVDTGFVWPDTNWHLVEFVGVTSTLHSLGFDGGTIYQASATAPTLPPSPNVLSFASDSAGGSGTLITLAYPAFYASALTPQQIQTVFLAASDPGAAFLQTAPGAGDVLSQILAAVRKTY